MESEVLLVEYVRDAWAAVCRVTNHDIPDPHADPVMQVWVSHMPLYWGKLLPSVNVTNVSSDTSSWLKSLMFNHSSSKLRGWGCCEEEEGRLWSQRSDYSSSHSLGHSSRCLKIKSPSIGSRSLNLKEKLLERNDCLECELISIGAWLWLMIS